MEHGIRTVIDLRGETELADHPPAELPVAVVSVPFLSGNQHERDALGAAAMQAAAHEPEGGVVIHCVGGKEIAADYALSEEQLRPRHEAWFRAAESDEELARLRRIARAPAASMVGVLAELERRYGGVAGEELELRRARVRG